MKKMIFIAALIITGLFLFGCSSTKNIYFNEKYKSSPKSLVKKISIVVKSRDADTKLASLVAKVSSDVIKLNRNYLVYSYLGSNDDWSKLCEKREGIIYFEIEKASYGNGKAYMKIYSAVQKCAGKELVWSAVAELERDSLDKNLENMRKTYSEKYGDCSEKFTAVVFPLIQDIVDAMPQPILSDEEIMKKIELEN